MSPWPRFLVHPVYTKFELCICTAPVKKIGKAVQNVEIFGWFEAVRGHSGNVIGNVTVR